MNFKKIMLKKYFIAEISENNIISTNFLEI